MKLGIGLMQTGRRLLVAIVVLAVAGEVANGQSRRGHATLGRQGVGTVGSRGSVAGGRDPLSTTDQKIARYQGVVTRRDQLQRILANTSPSYRRQYELASQRRQLSPAEIMLEQRNLLSVRSKLGKKLMQSDPYAELPEGAAESLLEPSVALDPTMTPVPMSHAEYLDLVSDRLSQKADDYYAIGQAHFRNGNYLKARGYFDMDREVNRDNPRAFFADVLTAGERRDVNRAYSSLLLALRRSETVDHLQVDKSAFFTDERRFERTLSVMNAVANQAPDQPAGFALVAFYAYGNGDLIAARSALTKARELSKDTTTLEILDKFKRLIETPKAEASPTREPAPALGTFDR